MQIVKARCARVQVGLAKGADMYHIHFDYGSTSALAATSLDELLAQWDSVLKPKLLDVLSTEILLNYAYCYCQAADAQVTAEMRYSNVTGTIAVEALPTNIALGIKLRQLDVSSRHNGSVRIPGCPEDAVVNSQWDNTFITTPVLALVTEMENNWVLSSNNWLPVVMQRFSGGAPITAVGNSVWNVAASLSPYTLRKRTTERRDYHP